ncbi:MAG: NAD(P)(+) transhydrogenase (Re/Si-specific) subunit beta [Myxococcota bacterium]
MSESLLTVVYLAAGILFILSLGGLSNQESARTGNLYGAIGMGLAILATAASAQVSSYGILAGGLVVGGGIGAMMARRVAMTAMPELVAILHSFVGLAAVLVGVGSFLDLHGLEGAALVIHLIEIYIGVFVGAVTFIGSIIAWGKLRGSIKGKPLLLPARHGINVMVLGVSLVMGVMFCLQPEQGMPYLLVMIGLSSFLGWHLVMAIGGADMPVVVSMLNSYSGWAAAAAGFMLSNDLLIVTGALVGSSGAILSYIMCKAMNRSFFSVILGGFGADEGAAPARKQTDQPAGEVVSVNSEETAQLLLDARSLVIIPGYGMAVAQAQHVVRELVEILRGKGKKVVFAIHPVAGRLPGHMNVLLAEANIPYDIVLEMDDFNAEMGNTDVALVIGANDIVNPGALDDPSSPIYGMPVLEVWKTQTCIMMKRSMAAGYAGVENPLCFRTNTRMLFGDARKSLDAVVTRIKTLQDE